MYKRKYRNLIWDIKSTSQILLIYLMWRIFFTWKSVIWRISQLDNLTCGEFSSHERSERSWSLTMQNIYFVWSSPLHCPTRSWKPFILFSARRFSSFITRKYHHTATLISYKCMGLDGIDPTLKTSPPILVFGFGQRYIHLLLPPKDTFLWMYVVWEDTYIFVSEHCWQSNEVEVIWMDSKHSLSPILSQVWFLLPDIKSCHRCHRERGLFYTLENKNSKLKLQL